MTRHFLSVLFERTARYVGSVGTTHMTGVGVSGLNGCRNLRSSSCGTRASSGACVCMIGELMISVHIVLLCVGADRYLRLKLNSSWFHFKLRSSLWPLNSGQSHCAHAAVRCSHSENVQRLEKISLMSRVVVSVVQAVQAVSVLFD